MAVLFISIGRMPFLAPTLDEAGLLFVLVITPGLFLQHLVVGDQDQLVAVYKPTTKKYCSLCKVQVKFHPHNATLYFPNQQ